MMSCVTGSKLPPNLAARAPVWHRKRKLQFFDLLNVKTLADTTAASMLISLAFISSWCDATLRSGVKCSWIYVKIMQLQLHLPLDYIYTFYVTIKCSLNKVPLPWIVLRWIPNVGFKNTSNLADWRENSQPSSHSEAALDIIIKCRAGRQGSNNAAGTSGGVMMCSSFSTSTDCLTHWLQTSVHVTQVFILYVKEIKPYKSAGKSLKGYFTQKRWSPNHSLWLSVEFKWAKNCLKYPSIQDLSGAKHALIKCSVQS